MQKDEFWNFLSCLFHPEAVVQWLVVIGGGGEGWGGSEEFTFGSLLASRLAV